jgi:hypothetical protein
MTRLIKKTHTPFYGTATFLFLLRLSGKGDENVNKWLFALLATIVMFNLGPHLSWAELAEQDQMPYVTLIDSFTLYSSSETTTDEVIGSLSALQSVQMAPIEQNELMGITRMDKVPVETWLGVAWINLKEGAYKFGKLEYQDQNLTLLDEDTPIFDAPRKETEYKLSKQKVQAIASIMDCDPFTPCRNKDKWFLIHTSWLGDKWIRPDHYAEKYKGDPVEGMIPINSERPVYLFPFEKPLSEEPTVKPQVIKPIDKYIQQDGMVPPIVWYQIDTSNGTRWLLQDDSYGLGVEGVEQVNVSIDMPIPFHYYRTPFAYSPDSQNEQSPQTLQAVGKIKNWYFVINDGTGKWVNPAKEIASRLTGDFENDAKLGVKLSSVQVQLTGASVALDTPYVEPGQMQNVLTFSPQTVTASRIWTSPNGESWYYIYTWQGPKWVRP